MLDSRTRSASENGSDIDVETIIVGAGFGGIGMAIALQAAGKRSFVLLERAGGVGGTWRDNVYPGCACDIPGMLYSFSFAPNAGWKRTYPLQAELLEYLRATVREHGLQSHIRFNTPLVEARYDEDSRNWTVWLGDGSTLRCRALIFAMGPLGKPALPSIPGRETFTGTAFHSSRWDHEVDLRGKRIAVVGTGASAIQFVPKIAERATHVTIFQRTPPWIVPRGDKPISALQKRLRKHIPFFGRLERQAIYWALESRALAFAFRPEILRWNEPAMLRYLARAVPDPALRAKLTPAYRAGCKRILISDDYYPALQRANVDLVASAVREIRSTSVLSEDGREAPVDVIIFGTGFEATSGVAPIRVFGSQGRELGADEWYAGMHAYLGTNVCGFPNLFFVIGPNTGLGHNSMIVMMEAQYAYIASALEYLRRSGARAIDVKRSTMVAFNERLQRRMKSTVWATGCSSWYQDANGNNVSLWPGFTFVFRRLTRRFNPEDYNIAG